MNEFHECFARCFEHVWPELRGADVFVDDIWSDVLHWNTAPAAVLGAQPACVLALMPDAAATPLPRTHPAPADERRAVFFVGSFLHTYKDACVRILKSRSEGRAPYRECVVYSAISNLGHARCMASVQRQFGTKDAYTWLQDTLCDAIGPLEDGTRPFVFCFSSSTPVIVRFTFSDTELSPLSASTYLQHSLPKTLRSSHFRGSAHASVFPTMSRFSSLL